VQQHDDRDTLRTTQARVENEIADRKFGLRQTHQSFFGQV